VAKPQDETSPGAGFWRFSLAFYALPGVAAALIALQDAGGFDVNLILFGLWLGCSGRGRLDRERLTAAECGTKSLRTGIVAPLRALRRQLEPSPEADVRRLRKAIAALELAAEKAVQQRLAAFAGSAARLADAARRSADAQANLVLYLGDDGAGGAEAAVIHGALAAFCRRD
jgi:uncharacterized protein (TIGR02444 family)